MIRAIIFDVDGTMAETEELHRQAFNQAFAEQGLDWVWDRPTYARLLATTGGRERIMVHASLLGSTVDAASLHCRKTEIYNQLLREGGIALRPGVAALIAHARTCGLLLAIGTTTSRPNVVSLLDVTLGEGSASWFSSIRTGEDVSTKKPDPQVYQLVLADLGLQGAECLCIEDSRNGLRAALAAGIPTIVTPSLYSAGEDFSGATQIVHRLPGSLPAPALPNAPLAGAPLHDLVSLLYAENTGIPAIPVLANADQGPDWDEIRNLKGSGHSQRVVAR